MVTLTTPVMTAIALGAVAACAVAEWLHARRGARIARLSFGREGRARAWTRAVPAARCVAAGLLCWGLLVLLRIDGGARAEVNPASEPSRRLLICLDVSPSMLLEDAGPEGTLRRSRRAQEVLASALARLDMNATRVSIVAFYTGAKPVVIDTFDLEIVMNALDGLPLEHAFEVGQTRMYEGVRLAAEIARPWAPGSAALLVVSDGDTLPDSGLPSLPPSIADVLVVGVGNPHRGAPIAGRTSRQDAASLERLALRLRGAYHDGNARHIPSELLRGFSMSAPDRERPRELRAAALVAAGAGGTTLAAISPLLAAAGRRAPEARRNADRREAERATGERGPGRAVVGRTGAERRAARRVEQGATG